MAVETFIIIITMSSYNAVTNHCWHPHVRMLSEYVNRPYQAGVIRHCEAPQLQPPSQCVQTYLLLVSVSILGDVGQIEAVQDEIGGELAQW